MNKRTAIAIISLACLSTANAETLVGSLTVNTSGGARAVFESLTLGWGLWIDGMGELPENRLFIVPDSEIGVAHVGTTWTADSAVTTKILEQFADDDSIDALGHHSIIQSQQFGDFESYSETPEWIFPNVGLDLEQLASQTDEIRLTLLSFSTESPGDDPWGDGFWTDWQMQYRFDFVTIPSPGTFIILAPLLATTRRRR